MHIPPRPGSGYSPPVLNRPAYPNTWRSLRTRLQPPQGMVAMAAEAVLWVASAAAVRVLVDLLVLLVPWLWLPMAAVLLTPAAIALIGATWAPPLSLLLGYRLCLVAIGLVVGG